MLGLKVVVVREGDEWLMLEGLVLDLGLVLKMLEMGYWCWSWGLVLEVELVMEVRG